MADNHRQSLYQQQREAQIQKLSPQQYLLATLLELPVTDLEQRVRDELYENVALEEGRETTDEIDDFDTSDDADGRTSDDVDDASAESLSVYDDDDLPTYTPSGRTDVGAEIPIGDTRSFIEDLQAQIADYDVDDHQRLLIDYLIGSLDDRGFVDRPLHHIADDLLFNHNVETDERELEQALAVLQRFDPVGIGARTLQECLLIQIDRQIEDLQSDEPHAVTSSLTPEQHEARLRLLRLERAIIADEFALFERNELQRMADALGVSTERIQTAVEAISRLNPHPGRSLHEAADDRVQTVVPDFIVETDHERSISFTLNNGEVPPLHVSRDYLQQLQHSQGDVAHMTRPQRDAYVYTKQKVEAAQMFITAIRQRQQTLVLTMQAIIDLQRDFILTQDDYRLQPLRLADVAQRTGMNISTISRVVNSKYAMIDGVLYPLKYFFLRSKTNADGQAVVRTRIDPLLRSIIENEDKQNPLSDEQISVLMKQKDEAISRRTVAKYRDELGIPVAALRRRIQ